MVFAYFIRILEFRMDSKLPQQQTSWDLVYVTPKNLFQQTSEGCAIWDLLWLPNRCSSTESAQANTEDDYLDYSDKSTEWISKKRKFL